MNAAGAEESARVPRRVWKSTALLVLGRFWGVACTIAVLGLLARHLTGGEFGRLTFYLAILALLDGVADFGTSTVLLRRGAQDPDVLASMLPPARRIRATAAGIGFLLVAVPALALGEEGAAWVTLAALVPVTRVLEASAIVYQRDIAWGVPVTIRAVVAVWRLALALLLVLLEVDAFGPFLLAHASGGALSGIALHLAARRRIPTGIARAAVSGVLRSALPLAAAGTCQQAYFYVDNLFLRHFRGELELGRYNASVRILSFLILVATYATTSALPWLARRHREGDLGRATARLARGLFLVACLGLGLLHPFAERLLALLFGPGFEAAAPALRWLFGATAAIYLGAGFFTSVVASSRTGAVLAIAAGGLALNAFGNLILVPDRGMEGAAMATFGTELFVAFASLALLVRSGARPLGRPWWIWLAGPLLYVLAAWGLALAVS